MVRMGEIELLPHQVEALEKFRGVQNVLVGDDTGTGKTITGIALVQQLYDIGELGPTLIVSDSFDTWTDHLEKMGVDRSRVHVINKKNREPFIKALGKVNEFGCEFYIVHWTGLRIIVDELATIRWLVVVGDEVHKGKSRKAQRTKALKRLKCAYKMGLSATPGDDKPQDIWSVLNWLYPEQYKSFWRFVHTYVETEVNKWQGYTVFKGPKNVEQFQAEIEPFYISRPINVVDDTIPKPEYYTIDVVMSDEQAEAYKSMTDMQLAEIGDDIVIAPIELAIRQRLQQFAMAYGRIEYKKYKTFVDGKMVTRFRTVVRQVEPSPKLDAFMAVLEGEGDGPVVAFTQFRDIVTLACKRMDEAGIEYEAVMGGVGDLDKATKRFQDGKTRVLIGVVDVIGEQVTLTRSPLEVFIDRPWSARMNKQAEGRIVRIGQKQTPRIIDIRTKNTVDFSRLERVKTKAEWLDVMFGRK